MSVSDEILKRMADAYRRIRNTARYLLANLDGFNPETDCVATKDLLYLDRWILEQTHQLQDEIVSAYQTYQFHQIYQKLHHYCVVTLGGFYLDIIKDRMYTCQPDSHARRSAQTTMYYVAEAFACWLAPILSFTAEEIWKYLPGDHSESIFLEEWYEKLPKAEAIDNHWEKIVMVREEVSKELEKLRVTGAIGSSLDAEIEIYANDDFKSSLDTLEDELRFVLITSYARVYDADKRPDDAVASELDGLWLKVLPSEHVKCIRCWHHREDVGNNSDHPEICGRCIDNIEGAGEQRQYC